MKIRRIVPVAFLTASMIAPLWADQATSPAAPAELPPLSAAPATAAPVPTRDEAEMKLRPSNPLRDPSVSESTAELPKPLSGPAMMAHFKRLAAENRAREAANPKPVEPQVAASAPVAAPASEPTPTPNTPARFVLSESKAAPAAMKPAAESVAAGSLVAPVQAPAAMPVSAATHAPRTDVPEGFPSPNVPTKRAKPIAPAASTAPQTVATSTPTVNKPIARSEPTAKPANEPGTVARGPITTAPAKKSFAAGLGDSFRQLVGIKRIDGAAPAQMSSNKIAARITSAPASDTAVKPVAAMEPVNAKQEPAKREAKKAEPAKLEPTLAAQPAPTQAKTAITLKPTTENDWKSGTVVKNPLRTLALPNQGRPKPVDSTPVTTAQAPAKRSRARVEVTDNAPIKMAESSKPAPDLAQPKSIAQNAVTVEPAQKMKKADAVPAPKKAVATATPKTAPAAPVAVAKSVPVKQPTNVASKAASQASRTKHLPPELVNSEPGDESPSSFGESLRRIVTFQRTPKVEHKPAPNKSVAKNQSTEAPKPSQPATPKKEVVAAAHESPAKISRSPAALAAADDTGRVPWVGPSETVDTFDPVRSLELLARKVSTAPESEAARKAEPTLAAPKKSEPTLAEPQPAQEPSLVEAEPIATDAQPAVTEPETPATKPAPGRAVAEDAPLGLENFCPVSLVTRQEWVRGNARWEVVHHGRTFQFASESERLKFLANPDAFAPVNNGNDLVLSSRGETTSGRCDFGVLYSGRIYLFAGEATLNEFMASPAKFGVTATK
jgi:YHS domain-containing protein